MAGPIPRQASEWRAGRGRGGLQTSLSLSHTHTHPDALSLSLSDRPKAGPIAARSAWSASDSECVNGSAICAQGLNSYLYFDSECVNGSAICAQRQALNCVAGQQHRTCLHEVKIRIQTLA